MRSALFGNRKDGTTDEKNVTGVIEDMQSDGGVQGSKALSYEAETERRSKHE